MQKNKIFFLIIILFTILLLSAEFLKFFVFFLCFILFLFVLNKKNIIEKEDDNYLFPTLLLFSLGANYKFIYLYFKNISQIPFVLFFITITIGIILFFSLYFVFGKIFKNKADSICATLLVLCAINIIKQMQLSSILVVLGGIFLIFTILILLNTKAIVHFLKKFIAFLLFFCVANCVFENTRNLIYFFNKSKVLSAKYEISKDFIQDKNVYIIVFDMYTGDSTLKYLNYDNKDFWNFLEKENFVLHKNFDSNYNRTILTLSSFLNMNYVEDIKHKTPKEAIKNAEMFKIAKLLDYKIFYRNPHTLVLNFKKNDFDYLTNDDTFKVESAFHFLLGNSFCYQTLLKNFYNRFFADNPNNSFFEFVFQKKCKKFVFAHYMMPHYPYLYDEDGIPLEEKFDTDMGDYYVINKVNYIKYLKYTNLQAKKIIKKIKENDPNAIIVILGDHGPKITMYKEGEESAFKKTQPDKMFLFASFNTFIAYYNININKEVNNLTNFSREFANKLFSTKMKMLKNKKFFIYNDEGNKKIKDIKGFYVEE